MICVDGLCSRAFLRATVGCAFGGAPGLAREAAGVVAVERGVGRLFWYDRAVLPPDNVRPCSGFCAFCMRATAAAESAAADASCSPWLWPPGAQIQHRRQALHALSKKGSDAGREKGGGGPRCTRGRGQHSRFQRRLSNPPRRRNTTTAATGAPGGEGLGGTAQARLRCQEPSGRRKVPLVRVDCGPPLLPGIMPASMCSCLHVQVVAPRAPRALAAGAALLGPLVQRVAICCAEARGAGQRVTSPKSRKETGALKQRRSQLAPQFLQAQCPRARQKPQTHQSGVRCARRRPAPCGAAPRGRGPGRGSAPCRRACAGRQRGGACVCVCAGPSGRGGAHFPDGRQGAGPAHHLPVMIPGPPSTMMHMEQRPGAAALRPAGWRRAGALRAAGGAHPDKLRPDLPPRAGAHRSGLLISSTAMTGVTGGVRGILRALASRGARSRNFETSARHGHAPIGRVGHRSAHRQLASAASGHRAGRSPEETGSLAERRVVGGRRDARGAMRAPECSECKLLLRVVLERGRVPDVEERGGVRHANLGCGNAWCACGPFCSTCRVVGQESGAPLLEKSVSRHRTHADEPPAL